MLVELHIVQNFAPANLNRDDTGAPKDAEFGGYRRARISSQCIKRAVRTLMKERQLVAPEDLAVRTKRLRQALIDRARATRKLGESAESIVDTALATIGFPCGDDGKSEYLLFVGTREIDRLLELCDQHQDDLKGAVQGEKPKGGKAAKKAAKEAVKGQVRDALIAALDGGKARDLALFGRMVADRAESRVDAACQVAHALSTHQVNMEFDYFTAVDDLKPEDTAGADMIGDVQFNSACFYRYANVDLDQLAKNLGGDRTATLETATAFIEAAVHAVPSGKQNSMAALNPPSLVMVVARKAGAWSLVNAFVDPIRPTRETDLVAGSVRKLDRYWQKLTTLYGHDSVAGAWVCTTEVDALDNLKAPPVCDVNSFPQLLAVVRTAFKEH